MRLLQQNTSLQRGPTLTTQWDGFLRRLSRFCDATEIQELDRPLQTRLQRGSSLKQRLRRVCNGLPHFLDLHSSVSSGEPAQAQFYCVVRFAFEGLQIVLLKQPVTEQANRLLPSQHIEVRTSDATSALCLKPLATLPAHAMWGQVKSDRTTKPTSQAPRQLGQAIPCLVR